MHYYFTCLWLETWHFFFECQSEERSAADYPHQNRNIAQWLQLYSSSTTFPQVGARVQHAPTKLEATLMPMAQGSMDTRMTTSITQADSKNGTCQNTPHEILRSEDLP